MQNLQIKDRLAKLLAGENIIVEHRQVSTASFDVELRLLTLPMWVMSSAAAYDMLIGHEVGHALYTPLYQLDQFISNRDGYKDGKYKQVEYSHMNIVEDIRIENLLHKKFPGFRKTFNKGYSDLHAMDFFGVGGRDIDKMSFMDRLNLHFKIGNDVFIKFSEEELDAIDKIKNNVCTYDDVLDFCLEAKELNIKSTELHSNDMTCGTESESSSFDAPMDSSEDEGDTVSTKSSSIPEDEDDRDPEDLPKTNPPDLSDVNHDDQSDDEMEDDVNTQDSFESNLNKLIDTETYERTYVNIPDVKLESILVGPEKIEKECESYQKIWEYHLLHEKYYEFKKDSQSSVNYMIKEFQTKKSADDYARSYSARTGVLDNKKLHEFKFTENIFKQIQVVRDGQNHGMIFILDWSGSMQNCILETTKQLLQLVWFCKKQNIPFDVYAFTNGWNRLCKNPDYLKMNKFHDRIQTIKHNDIMIDPNLDLLNFISSKRSPKDFDNDCRNLFIIASLTKNFYGTRYPSSFNMSSTPLNSTIIALRKIIPEFYKTTRVDCLSTIILSDGESDHLSNFVSYDKSPMAKWKEDSDFYCSAVRRSVIRDIDLGCVYPEIVCCDYRSGMSQSTKCLLQNLKDHFPSMNLIGIRLVAPSETQNFLGGYANDHCSRATWTTSKNICLKDTPYDMLYGLSTTILNKDVSIDIPEDASIAKINNAIRKSLKAKHANRKMLCSFIDTIS